MKRIAFGIVVMLLIVFSSTTIVRVNSATGASIVISPNTTVSPNSAFILNLTINNVANMRAWDVTFVYQNIINLTNVQTINGTTFTDGFGLSIVKTEDYNSSYYWTEIARSTQDIVPGSGTGSGLVAQLNFTDVASSGTTTFYFTEAEIQDSNMVDITPITFTTPTITVASVQPTPTPSQTTVGGTSFSVAKNDAFPAYYIGLASIVIIAVAAIIATTIYFKGIKRRKEKQ